MQFTTLQMVMVMVMLFVKAYASIDCFEIKQQGRVFRMTVNVFFNTDRLMCGVVQLTLVTNICRNYFHLCVH